jgi:hypothetical protein
MNCVYQQKRLVFLDLMSFVNWSRIPFPHIFQTPKTMIKVSQENYAYKFKPAHVCTRRRNIHKFNNLFSSENVTTLEKLCRFIKIVTPKTMIKVSQENYAYKFKPAHIPGSYCLFLNELYMIMITNCAYYQFLYCIKVSYCSHLFHCFIFVL